MLSGSTEDVTCEDIILIIFYFCPKLHLNLLVYDRIIFGRSFGSLRQSSENVRNLPKMFGRVRFGTILENLQKSSESKSDQKRCHWYVYIINKTALTRAISS